MNQTKTKKLSQRNCEACGDTFSPEVAKVGIKYCSDDCLYELTGKKTEKCVTCGDEFLPEYTGTPTVACSLDCLKGALETV